MFAPIVLITSYLTIIKTTIAKLSNMKPLFAARLCDNV